MLSDAGDAAPPSPIVAPDLPRVAPQPEWRRDFEEMTMPRGDKSKYTDKQERKADHIAESYEDRGVSEKEAERRAWATVSKDDGGGKKSGSGRGEHTGHPAAHKGGEGRWQSRRLRIRCGSVGISEEGGCDP